MNNTLKNLENNGLSIVIGSYNRKAFLKKTIETLRTELESCLFSHEIIIIDGGSTDGTLSWLINQKDIITIIQHNRGEWKGQPIEQRSWGYFMNLGFKSAKGKYICMISDDCLVIPGAIKNGYNLFESKLKNNENVGGIAFLFRDWPERKNYSYITHYGFVNVNHGIYLKKALETVNFADENTFRFYNGDVDLVFKLAVKNYSVIISKASLIEHFSHANIPVRRKNLQIALDDDNQFIIKWSPIFEHIKLNSFKENMIYNEVFFSDKYNTIQYWKKLKEVNIFMLRRFFSNHVPIIIKIRLAKLIKKMSDI